MRISLLLMLGMLTLLMYSCASSMNNKLPSDKNDPGAGTAQVTQKTPLDNIPTPESYGKQASFDSIVYERPSIEAILDLIDNTEDLAESRDTPYDQLSAAVLEVDAAYSDFSTMLTYLTVKTSANSADAALASEYSMLSEAAVELEDELEELLVALAHSSHAENLEKNIFGEGFFKEYSSERLTDRASELLSEEAKLENEYRALSETTVFIEYDGKHAPYSSIKEYINRLYAGKPTKRDAELKKCEKLYKKELDRSTRRIFIDLLRVRKLIATELGYKSYTDYAYDTIYHDYSPEDMERLCENIAKYVIPVMSNLDDKLFYNYFTKNSSSKTATDELIPALGGIYRGVDRELAGIYGFMEHYSLFDVEISSPSRDEGAYTTYFAGLDSPFIFMTASGSITDFSVLSHEFGHFYDSFINSGERASLDTLELSSQALELLTLNMLKPALKEADYRYLYYFEMRSMLSTLIYQSFYSAFEHLAYSLEYSEITEANLTELVAQQAERMNLPKSYFGELGYVLTDHTVLYPHYVQSYAVSLIPSLEIYFAECEAEGVGLALYKSVVNRDGNSDFLSSLGAASLSSPFNEKTVKSIADEIHFSILGYHFYKEFDAGQNAA